MPGEPDAKARAVIRGDFAFGVFGIVVLFAGLVLFLLLLNDGDGVHGGGMSMSGHGGNMTSSSGDGGNLTSMGNHGPPRFVQSFGFVGLAAIGLYLAALTVWAGVRGRWTFLGRHAVSATVMILLAVLYLNARGGFAYNGHNWNRSFADASVLLYGATLAIGPLARLWRPASAALSWRRETGIWATIAAAVHVGIFWEWSLAWDWRPFFYPGEHGAMADTLMGDRSTGVLPSAFNVANVVGLVALVYALVLTVTSNDASQRWLKSGWSWLQERSTTMWLLVLLHTWLFAYYITGEQTLPIGTLWASFWMVLLLQTGAFAKTVWHGRLGRTSAGKGPAPSTLR